MNEQMYELYDPCTVMFFYRYVYHSYRLMKIYIDSLYTRNKHIMIDLGTGNNNKMYVLAPSPPYAAMLTIYP